MPAHYHPGPACSQKSGLPCSPTTCGDFNSCRQGGRLIACQLQPDGSCLCFHSDWVGPGEVEIEPASVKRERNAVLDPRWLDPLESRPQTLDQALSRFRPHAPRHNADGTVRPSGPAIGRAYALVEEFVTKPAPGVFPKIDRFSVAEGVLERVNQPVKVSQGQGWWCGPAAFMYSLARQDPPAYAKFVFDLYDYGKASTTGSELIVPSVEFLGDPVPRGENSADWIALGGLRDASNWWYRYHRQSRWEHEAGGTSEDEVEKWFKNFGFREVINKTSSSACDLDNLKLAESYAKRNYRVVLSLHADVIQGSTTALAKGGGDADHFVVLTGAINYGPPIKMRVYTWGGYETIPGTDMKPEDFLKSYHGFVAGRR
jgi:hypothetical protein